MEMDGAIKRDIKREVRTILSGAINGKTVRGSFNTRKEQKAIHLVSAWATENRLVFAQVKIYFEDLDPSRLKYRHPYDL
jgi:hypothetical protein